MTRHVRCSRTRCGFTIMDTLIAIGILMFAMALALQLGAWSLAERARNATRQEALEAAVNVMEAARAQPYDELTPEWAEKQKLPEALAQRLHEEKMTVRVEPEPARPHVKRVTVEIGWKHGTEPVTRPVRLVGLFGERSGAGGKP